MGEFSPAAAEAASLSEQNRPWWKGNFNVYWLIGVVFGLWFLFVHAPLYLASRPQGVSFGLWLHLVGAGGTYLICMWNTFHTPSQCVSSRSQSRGVHRLTKHPPIRATPPPPSLAASGPVYHMAHITLGRVAIFLSVLGFISGAYIAWKPGTDVEPSLAIGLTVGGTAQMICTFGGLASILRYKALKSKGTALPDGELGAGAEVAPGGANRRLKAFIRSPEVALRAHAGFMLGLFLPSCGTPAAMRTGPLLGLSGLAALGIFVGLLSLASARAETAIFNKKVV